MGDPITIGLGLASTAATAAGGIMSANAQKASNKANAIRAQMKVESAKTAEQAGRVRALQTDASYRDQLDQTLSNMAAMRAGQNVSVDSPTALAMAEAADKKSALARQVAVSNEIIGALDSRKAGISAATDAQMIRAGNNGLMAAALLKALPQGLSTVQSMFPK